MVAMKKPKDERVNRLTQMQARVRDLWKQVDHLYPTEDAALDALYKLVEKELRCDKCGGANFDRYDAKRIVICSNCKNKVWFTSGTFFDGVKNAKAWLGAIFVMGSGELLSGPLLHGLAHIAISTAQNILHKIRVVIKEEMGPTAALAESFSFIDLFTKRSAETPPRLHPSEEELQLRRDSSNSPATDSDKADTVNDGETFEPGTVTDFAVVDLELKIAKLLLTEPMTIEALCAELRVSDEDVNPVLIMMEIKGSIARIAGSKFVSTDAQKPSKLKDLADTTLSIVEIPLAEILQTLSFVHGGGCSRKYLQDFLAEYWCYADRESWTVEKLMRSCIGARYCTNRELMQYVSPLQVFVLPRIAAAA